MSNLFTSFFGNNTLESTQDDDTEAMEELKTELDSLKAQLTALQSQNQGDSSSSSNAGAIGQVEGQIQQVTEVKMQAFYETEPELWFIVVESQFAARKITNEKTRYSHVVANLNCSTASQVKDLLKTPFAEGHYDKLKQQLISIYAETASEKFRKLISNAEIGDKKPSQFLHYMKSLADNSITNDFIKKLWIQRLPAASRAVLSASKDELDDLAKMADQMWEVSDRFNVNAVKVEKNPLESKIDKLASALEKLSQRINNIDKKEHVSRRDSTPHHSRSRSKSTQSRDSTKETSDTCWFHRKFGDAANKCREPCKFNTQSKN